MRYHLIVLLAALAGLALVPSAGAWDSNFWRSPTRNIACRYYPAPLETVTCQTDNDRFSVAVQRYGLRTTADKPSGFRTFYRWIPSWAPVLSYGAHWTAPGFNCVSSVDGMSCRTQTGHGFFLSRSTWRAW